VEQVWKLHSKRVEKMWNYTRNEWRRCEITLGTSGEDVKSHSKRVEKIGWICSDGPNLVNYWSCQIHAFDVKPLEQIILGKNTLKTSGEDVKTTLVTSGEDVKTTLKTSGKDLTIHSKRVEKIVYHLVEILDVLRSLSDWGFRWNLCNVTGAPRTQ
jgi:hypothetical protein